MRKRRVIILAAAVTALPGRWSVRFALLCVAVPKVALAGTGPAATPANEVRWDPSRTIVEDTLGGFEATGQSWKSGDTNLPLVSIEWFGGETVISSSVSQEGKIRNSSANEFGTKGWGWGDNSTLTHTNLNALKALIALLPPSVSGSVPANRRILVSGIRNNSWFALTYDRADVPPELERVCEFTGGQIDWVVPSTVSSTNSLGRAGGDIQHLVTARAPVAVAYVVTAVMCCGGAVQFQIPSAGKAPGRRRRRWRWASGDGLRLKEARMGRRGQSVPASLIRPGTSQRDVPTSGGADILVRSFARVTQTPPCAAASPVHHGLARWRRLPRF
jgi:hypothetical protein